MKTRLFLMLILSISALMVSVYALASNRVKYERQTNGTLNADWLYGWSFRKAHNITGSAAGVQTNYPILLSVHYDNGYDIDGEVYLGGKSRTDFGDVRFTDSTGTSSLSYYMQQKVDGVYAAFWVKVSYIPESPSYATIYIYYGNSTATTTSNKDLTLNLKDDFEDGMAQGWTKTWTSYATSDGVSTDAYQGIYSRVAGRYYGSSAAGTGNFYERFFKTLYLTSGSYVLEGAARFGDIAGLITPQEIRFLVNGISIAEVSNPGSIWRWLQGNFTVDASGTVELSVEFHQIVSSYLVNGGLGYFMDSILVRKWCNPEPAHGDWGSEAPWMVGDINGDGKVDVEDLRILGENYGKFTFIETEKLNITSMTFSGTSGVTNNNTIVLNVKNPGTSKVTVTEVRVNDVAKTCWVGSAVYDPGGTGTIVIYMEPGSGWVSGNKYKVTLLSANGTTLATYETTA